MGSGAKLDLQAFTDATCLPFPRIVKDVSGLIGLRLVAYIAGVVETRAVQQWVDGSRPMDPETEKRLRLAAQPAKLIAGHDSAAVAQAWFQGLNPQLDDRSPARLLREGDITDVGPKLLAAARSFAAGG
ncbi:MAG: hypothetical protein ACREF4_03320 [Gammaproteobacteria bacterium]